MNLIETIESNFSDDNLNLFNSYAQGKLSGNYDSKRILEDNVTRAFLITMAYNPKFAMNFCNKFFLYPNTISFEDEINIAKHLSYDLQNINNKQDLNFIQECNNKILLGITPYQSDVRMKEDIYVYKSKDFYIEIFNWLETNKDTVKRKTFEKNIKGLIDNYDKNISQVNLKESKRLFDKTFYNISQYIKYEDVTIEDIEYIYETSKGSRPDGWIWSKEFDFAVLIENKIKGNLLKEQLFRHITQNTGFNLKVENIEKEINVIILTWNQIYKFIDNYKSSQTQNYYYINNFKKYLDMININLNPYSASKSVEKRLEFLKEIINSMEKQINLNSELNEIKSKLKIKGKYSGKYVGIEIGTRNVHYNVNFQPDSIGISLTLWQLNLNDNKNKSDNIINDKRNTIVNFVKDILNKYIANKEGLNKKLSKEQNLLSRYSISFRGYRKYMKLQSGEGFHTFSNEINFFEFGMNNYSNKKLELLYNMFDLYNYSKKLGISKQIDISYNIIIPDLESIDSMKNKLLKNRKKVNYENDIRYINYELLQDGEDKDVCDKLADDFVRFIIETKELAIKFGL